ncbi:ABC transporter ATP-binding protein [Oceanibacterium hippocampi]
MMEVSGLNAYYGEIQALLDISFDLAEGEVIVFLGPNGAGKSTLMRSLAGLHRPSSGQVNFDGKRLDGLPAWQIARMGIALVPEGRQLFPPFTVMENLELGSLSAADQSRTAQRQQLEFVLDLFPRLAERRTQRAGSMSGGEQQMLAIGRALMSDPRLLFLDEPSAGLAPLIIEQIYQVVARLSDEGKTMIIVEQNAEIALGVAQRGYVLELGQIRLSGEAGELSQSEEVRRIYMGG